MARTLLQSNISISPKTQLQTKNMQYPALCDLINFMVAIPANSGWMERTVEQLCQKRRKFSQLST